LIIAAQNLAKYEHFLLLVRVLVSYGYSTGLVVSHQLTLEVFFGYPHNPSGAAALQEQLFGLAIQGRQKVLRWGYTLPLMADLPEAIMNINGLFCRAKIMLRARLVNIFSSTSEQVRISLLARQLV
jgi:hypothetical protein